MSTIAQARAKLRRWRRRPEDMVREEFGVEPDPSQLDVLRAFPSQDPDKLRISMQAVGGNGKTAILAWTGWNFLSCYGEFGEHPKGAILSVTGKNLKDNLVAEYLKWRDRSLFLREAFEVTGESIRAKDHPQTWFLSLRTWPKDADSETQGRTLAGLRGKFVLFQIDECATIPVVVLRAADNAQPTATWFKLMLAGNPITREGMLYAAATKLREQFMIVRCTADPDDPNRTPRIPVEWARKQIALYGRDDPMVKAFVFAEFPLHALNTLCTVEQVDVAMKRNPRESEYKFAPKIIGGDVARGGLHSSVIAPRQGCALFRLAKLRGADGIELGGRIARLWTDWGADAAFIDNTGGYGGSPIDQLRLLGFRPTPVEFAGKPNDLRYLNKRTEIYFDMASWVIREGAIPNDPLLARALTETMYGYSGDRLRLEDKDELIARLGFSPDEGDAVGCTFAQPVAAMRLAEKMLGAGRGVQPAADYDPFAWTRG